MKACGVLALIAMFQVVQVFGQGPLTPPGPPGPTMKTLDQIEPRIPISEVPYIISGSGAYYLIGDMTNFTDAAAITVQGGDVSIDLRGFSLWGTDGNVAGIDVASATANVRVENGSIRNFLKHAIHAPTLAGGIVRGVRALNNGSGMLLGSAALIEQCTVISNGNFGITVGANSRVRNCVATANGNSGIAVGDGSTVVDCISSQSVDGFGGRNASFANCSAQNNSARGFNLNQGAKLANCIATANGVIGISGNGEISAVGCIARGNGDCGFALFKVFGSETASLIKDCLMVNNINYGLLANARATVLNSTADFNQLAGMQFGEQGSSAIGCTVVSNRFFGISMAAGSLVQDCTVTRNGTTGIFGEPGTRVIGCNVSSNGVDGINVRAGSTVTRCTARGNGEDGIEVANDCVVSDNHCTANGSATTVGGGIHGTLSGNRIEGNHALLNDNGYRLDTAGNTVFRNTARDNGTNWVIVGGNDVGPIGTAAGSTSPFANIQF